MAGKKAADMRAGVVGDPAQAPAVSAAIATEADSSMPALDPALYVPQELRQAPRRDAYEVDEAINIIEEGEHVSADDFGLSSTEISMNAPITMNVGIELNAMQQFDAFLAARPSEDAAAAFLPDHRQQCLQPTEAKRMNPSDTEAAAEDGTQSEEKAALNKTMTQGPSEQSSVAIHRSSNADRHVTPIPSSISAQYPTRRDDKVIQLESHPLVDSVASDGRNVVCKCGKTVRLNPPWYIIKYDQHIVSRNCTFLRKKKTKRDLEAQQKLAISRAGKIQAVHDDANDESANSARHSAVTDESCEEVADSDGATTTVPGKDKKEDEYGLKTADELLRRERNFTTEDESENDNELSDHQRKNERVLKTLHALKDHPHFGRITPDGKFIECRCSELIILSVPWVLREFHSHVDGKSKPQAPSRRKLSSSTSTKKPRLGDGATHRVEQRLIEREKRWKPVSKHMELPCPGLRGERINVYINSTTKITGGSRARRRIAEDLFPHHFITLDKKKRERPRLTLDEKEMLRDAVESEALWFIDRDANAVRSLDCRGSMAANKDEECCVSCAELKSNASLRISVTVAIGHKRIPDDAVAPSDPTGSQSKHNGSVAAFAYLEQEFDMREEYARLLRDLFRAEVEENSLKNMWFDMAELGIAGLFAAHPAFMGLLESMMALKDKERRGVGLQNMAYSDHLDTFMKSIADISPQACDFFQQQLGGRKQKYLMLAKRRKVSGKEGEMLPGPSAALSQEQLNLGTTTSYNTADATLTTSSDGFGHLPFDLANSATMHNLADVHDVDISPFQTEQHRSISELAGVNSTQENDETDAFLTDENFEVEQDNVADRSPSNVPAGAPSISPITPGFIPCRGLRDPKVQAYVVNAVQIIGGSRPKYVIAKELFPEAFDGSQKVKITEKLTEEERGVVLDAIFSECLWRVDRVSNCVRSLRCFRRVDRKRGNGVCRACLELKSIANFRSVLCRAKVPKKVENLKYVPSVYTGSDPFMRKLSKNASLRTLYQTVKRTAPEDKKTVTFWLRLAKMGLFGNFRSHVAFEGLIASMVEIKDRERRGVGKQNMLYAKSLDEFMAALAGISMDAFELFSHHFCGRSLRSQKVKKRKALTQLYDSAIQDAMVANSLAMATAAAASVPEEATVRQSPLSSTMVPSHPMPSTATATATTDTQTMMMSEDLSARSIMTAEMEENQRFMDHMLGDVRLSEPHEDHEPDDQLDPQTYLDENGVLTTVL